MGYFSSFGISASGLTAQRLRMDVISQNIANANTTRTEDGGPYRRKVVTFQEKTGDDTFASHLESANAGLFDAGGGVRVTAVTEDPTAFREVYDPGNPDADENGIVQMPNVDVVTEMVNMISASRSYEANVTSLNASKSMAMKALEIGK